MFTFRLCCIFIHHQLEKIIIIFGSSLRFRLVLASLCAARNCNSENPIIQTNFTANPAPLVYHGKVYLYTSHDEDDAAGFKMVNWKLYTSTDMVN